MARRPSSIDRLDPALRDEIKALRDRGRTIDEILAKLRELGENGVSRSALGRHVQSIEEAGERLRRAVGIGEALFSHARAHGEDRLAEVNSQLLQASMQTFLLAVDRVDPESGEPVILSPLDASRIAKALSEVQRARATDVQRVKAIREEERKKTAEKIGEAGKASGLSAETVSFIVNAVLGGET